MMSTCHLSRSMRYMRRARTAWEAEEKHLLVDWELPDFSVVPVISRFRYIKSDDRETQIPARLVSVNRSTEMRWPRAPWLYLRRSSGPSTDAWSMWSRSTGSFPVPIPRPAGATRCSCLPSMSGVRHSLVLNWPGLIRSAAWRVCEVSCPHGQRAWYGCIPLAWPLPLSHTTIPPAPPPASWRWTRSILKTWWWRRHTGHGPGSDPRRETHHPGQAI